MSAIPPTLSVTVALPRIAGVLDVPLALSRHGLLAARRLSEEFDLWLVREFWQILDNTEHYVRRPDLLSARVLGFAGAAKQLPTQESLSAAVLQQWELARTEKDLAGLKLFWIGDGPSESLLPPGALPNLVERFEQLACALEHKLDEPRHSTYGSKPVLLDCFRDAVALVGALIPYRGRLLTCSDAADDDPTPPICRFLLDHKIDCQQIDAADKLLEYERALLTQVCTRAGLSELIWAGLRLAVVHVVLPNAVLIAPRSADEEEAVSTNLWDDAQVFWYSLTL